MTIQEFYDKLNTHDWFYAMSDDPRVYRAGRSNQSYLKKLSGEIPGGGELFIAFHKHYFSGPAFGVEGAPKPERPGLVIGMDDPMF